MKRLLIAATAVAVVAASGVAFLLAANGGSGSTPASAAAVGGGSASTSTSATGLLQQEASDKPWLGASLVQTPDGPAIAQVIAESPADAAGLQRGDVIEAVDGTAVDNVREVAEAIRAKGVGDTVALTISRDGQTQEVSATLAARPEPLPRAIPMLPELEGIPVDELYSHFQGGELRFTDADGNAVTAVIEAGTVASVDADAGTLTVDLNGGGSKTYTVEADDVVFRGGLSALEQGDRVTVMTVNGDVRAVLGGRGLPFLPGFGGRHGRGGPDGMMGPMRGHGFGEGPGALEPEEAPAIGDSSSGT